MNMKLNNPSFRHFTTVFSVAFVVVGAQFMMRSVCWNSFGYAGILGPPIVFAGLTAGFPRGLITYLPDTACLAGLLAAHVILVAIFLIGSISKHRVILWVYSTLLLLNTIGCFVGNASTNWQK